MQTCIPTCAWRHLLIEEVLLLPFFNPSQAEDWARICVAHVYASEYAASD